MMLRRPRPVSNRLFRTQRRHGVMAAARPLIMMNAPPYEYTHRSRRENQSHKSEDAFSSGFYYSGCRLLTASGSTSEFKVAWNHAFMTRDFYPAVHLRYGLTSHTKTRPGVAATVRYINLATYMTVPHIIAYLAPTTPYWQTSGWMCLLVERFHRPARICLPESNVQKEEGRVVEAR